MLHDLYVSAHLEDIGCIFNAKGSQQEPRRPRHNLWVDDYHLRSALGRNDESPPYHRVDCFVH